MDARGIYGKANPLISSEKSDEMLNEKGSKVKEFSL